MKLTFKKEQTNDKWFRSFTQIKLNKKQVGIITPPGRFSKELVWTIRFMIKKTPDKNDPAPFCLVKLKYKASSDEDAREFIRKNNDTIQEKYNLFLEEN